MSKLHFYKTARIINTNIYVKLIQYCEIDKKYFIYNEKTDKINYISINILTDFCL
jgi:hypothetical protein